MRIPLLLFVLGCSGIVCAEDDAENRRKLYLFFEGREVYQSQCVHCHGRSGKGDGPWAADFTKNWPRNFRSGVFKFRTTPMGMLPTDEDLVRTIRSGVSGTAMPAFRELRDDKLEAVIAYIKSFSKHWKDPERVAESVELPQPPDWMQKLASYEAHAQAGETLFAIHCAACHGAEGKGNGSAAVGLMDIWEHQIQPADLTAAHYKSGDRSEDWYRTIALGLDGTPMVGFHGMLSEAQIWDVIAFVRSLRAAS